MSQTSIPAIETYWSLVAKADTYFSRIRGLPYYDRNRYDTIFHKVFKIYTQLWKFQQENRQELVESGLKRWEIGEIASRIAQLYFGKYMHTSEASYLSESYIFYEAILSREYFKDGISNDIDLANKQLRFLTRFILVCLLLNRKELAHTLVDQLKMLAVSLKKAFKECNFKEWKMLIQEITKFLKADSSFMNLRPLRYSLVLDPSADHLSHYNGKKSLRLCDAILSSYHPHEVKFSELTVDTFRMIQCLEWEPSGSFYKEDASSTFLGAFDSALNMNSESIQVKCSPQISDFTLPSNPHKAVLYRPTNTRLIAVIATICDELPPDGIIFIYLSAPGNGHIISTMDSLKNDIYGMRNSVVDSKAQRICSYSGTHACNNKSTAIEKCKYGSDGSTGDPGCLYIGPHGSGGLNCIYPSDFIPFTRKPIFIVIDSDNSKVFQVISGVEKGERVAMLLSPSCSASICEMEGSFFTMFLTAPLQAFCFLIGISGPDIQMDAYKAADKLLVSSLREWEMMLITSDNVDPVWSQVLGDPLLRRILLRFIFCRAVLELSSLTCGRDEFLPECIPSLPESLSSASPSTQASVFRIASAFEAVHRFSFSVEMDGKH